MANKKKISAIILAAGQSKRMGQPKLLLPWGDTTVLGKVVSTLKEAGINDIHIVAGANFKKLQDALQGLPVEFVFNPNYENSEMIISVQIGLQSIHDSDAALIVLGDQPQVEVQTVQSVIDHYLASGDRIVVPSYQHHRGHPWLIDKSLWHEILNLTQTDTLRNYLNLNKDQISYINVDTASIIMDLDTPDDYLHSLPLQK